METIFELMKKPTLYTALSPALLHLYEVTNTIVVVIDVLRATSTIATVLHNGAKEIIPVDSVERCIQLVEGKTLVLTTTNGTKLLHMALAKGATEIITGSFLNLSAVCDHLIRMKKNVILACAGWKDKVNMEDSLFAGAVVSRVKTHFGINCDSSHIAETLYETAREDLYEFMKNNDASHYHRLTNFGLERDIRHCLTSDLANVLPEYMNGKLVNLPVLAPAQT